MTRSLLVVTLMFFSAAALAQTSFVIERIDVAESRVRPAIVRAETRLAAGRTYTTAQLDQAIYRVRRLPFVVDATYSLEPGSSPESRVMRISVADQGMFNYNLDVQGVAMTGGYATTTTGLGLRFFPAASGALDFSLGGIGFSAGGGRGSGHFGDVAAQYTAYGLFGTSACAGAGVITSYNSKDRLVSPLLLLGVPLTQTQTLRGTFVRNTDSSDRSTVVAAHWLFETTDDPYFTRRGVAIAAGPQWQKLHFVGDFNPGTKFFFHVDDRTDSRGFDMTAAKYWPMAQHSAYWARANASLFNDTGVNNGRDSTPVHERRGDFILGVAHDFDGGRGGGDEFRRGRVELGLGYHHDRTSSRFNATERSGPEVFAGFAYRSHAGVVHFGVGYVAR